MPNAVPRSMRVLACVLLAGLLAGCGGRPGGTCTACGAAPGTPCTTSADCGPGLCLPADQPPGGGGGTWTGSVCSTTCAAASDCVPGWDCAPREDAPGTVCRCSYATEVADGRDNDCDGIVDNVRPPTYTDKADILFMIDNSGSTEPPRTSLMQYFPNFMRALTTLPTPPDLHIGIVTSDLGAGQFTPPGCPTGGDHGMLQNTPKGVTCGTASLRNPDDRFLRYAEIDGTPQTNFTGDLADAFACYAPLGDNGCGFEHQLASVRAALEGCNTDAGCTQPANAGFLRPDALLAVILITDEDDCSVPPDSTLFDPSQTKVTSELGPLTSYRCFEFGNLCEGAPPGRSAGPRTNCEPGAWDPDPQHQLTPVQDFVSFLRSLKPEDPRLVYVALISGPAEPVRVGSDTMGYPDMQPACTGSMGTSDPTPRLHKFLGLFDGDRTRYGPICANDLSKALIEIGGDLAGILGGP